MAAWQAGEVGLRDRTSSFTDYSISYSNAAGETLVVHDSPVSMYPEDDFNGTKRVLLNYMHTLHTLSITRTLESSRGAFIPTASTHDTPMNELNMSDHESRNLSPARHVIMLSKGDSLENRICCL